MADGGDYDDDLFDDLYDDDQPAKPAAAAAAAPPAPQPAPVVPEPAPAAAPVVEELAPAEIKEEPQPSYDGYNAGSMQQENGDYSMMNAGTPTMQQFDRPAVEDDNYGPVGIKEDGKVCAAHYSKYAASGTPNSYYYDMAVVEDVHGIFQAQPTWWTWRWGAKKEPNGK